MTSLPVKHQLAVQIPLAKIPVSVKTACDERFPIWSPYATADWLSKTHKLLFDGTSLFEVSNILLSRKFDLTLAFHKVANLSRPHVTIMESSGLQASEQTPDS
jgi:hypothetical protein